MSILGAIIGDVVGSRFEWNNLKSKEFDLFTKECKPTDDSIMTLAIAEAVMDWDHENLEDLSTLATLCMRRWGRLYPNAGYGGTFIRWLNSSTSEPYNSYEKDAIRKNINEKYYPQEFTLDEIWGVDVVCAGYGGTIPCLFDSRPTYNSYGNGAAMRVSPCAYLATSLEEALDMAKAVTEVTHNHPEGIKGAQATTAAIYMALHGSSKEDIRDYIVANYYPLNFTLDQIRKKYKFEVSCQKSVPQAIEAFLESTNFEDAIRNAVSIGGDSDTIAAIAGSIAGAYYDIPEEIIDSVSEFMNESMIATANRFADAVMGETQNTSIDLCNQIESVLDDKLRLTTAVMNVWRMMNATRDYSQYCFLMKVIREHLGKGFFDAMRMK